MYFIHAPLVFFILGEVKRSGGGEADVTDRAVRAKAAFDEIDADGDGSLSQDELAALLKKLGVDDSAECAADQVWRTCSVNIPCQDYHVASYQDYHMLCVSSWRQALASYHDYNMPAGPYW